MKKITLFFKSLIYSQNLLILVILIIASFYRFYSIDMYMTFLGDEGRDVLVVYKILHGDLTLLGPTASVGGFFLGPIYYYFMVPFLWLFNYNPVGPAVMIAFFGIVTVWLIYKVGKEFFGVSVGLIAAGLYAISPLVVTYSRSSWNPNLMPFFSLLTLYLVYKAIRKNSVKLFILSGFLFGITMQLHYLTLFLGVVIAVYILLNNYVLSRKNFLTKLIKQYVYIFLGFIVGWLPFLAFEVRHGFKNIISIFNFIFTPQQVSGESNFFEIINDVFFRIFGRLVTNFPSPEKIPSWLDSNVNLWRTFTLGLGIVIIGFLLFKFLKSYKLKSSDFSKISLLLVWLIIGIGLFGFYKKSIYDYYFGFMFPLPFLIVGVFLKGIWTNKSSTFSHEVLSNKSQGFKKVLDKIGKILSMSILLILVWLNSLTPPYKYPANQQLNQAKEISKFVLEKTDNEPFNFALITGGNSDHAYRYFFKVWGKDPIVIENEKIDSQRATVTDQLLIVCESADCRPLGNPLWEIAGFGRAEIVGEWDISVVKVFKLEHYAGE